MFPNSMPMFFILAENNDFQSLGPSVSFLLWQNRLFAPTIYDLQQLLLDLITQKKSVAEGITDLRVEWFRQSN